MRLVRLEDGTAGVEFQISQTHSTLTIELSRVKDVLNKARAENFFIIDPFHPENTKFSLDELQILQACGEVLSTCGALAGEAQGEQSPEIFMLFPCLLLSQ